jgi:hypothetical protein
MSKQYLGIAAVACASTDYNVAPDHIDAIQMSNLSQTGILKVIVGKLCTCLTSHNELMLEWSNDFIWLCGQFPSIANNSLLTEWHRLIKQIRQEDLMGMAHLVGIDDDLEETVLDKVVDEGEEADDVWILADQPDPTNL